MKKRLIALIALCVAYLETSWELGRADIYELVDKERARQDDHWGGYDHDKTHSGADWLALIVKHIGKLADAFIA